LTAPPTAKANADSLAAASAAEHLRFAVSDLQQTIRGTDLKAEALGILITGLLAIAAFRAGGRAVSQ
jgi:phage baseplate assembly protein W